MAQDRLLVPGFTVIEIVVTLILTTIVFSIALFAYKVFHNQFQRYSSSISEQTELFILQQALNRDITTSQMIVRTDDGFECRSDSTSIRYVVDGNSLIRENAFAVQDSFHFHHLLLSVSFESEEPEAFGELIDKVTIEFTKGEKLSVFQVGKQYDAYTLILHKKN